MQDITNQKKKKPKIKIRCKYCGSEYVKRDADAMWNVDTQEWELVSVYDNATCEDCGGETSLIEEEIANEKRRNERDTSYSLLSGSSV